MARGTPRLRLNPTALQMAGQGGTGAAFSAAGDAIYKLGDDKQKGIDARKVELAKNKALNLEGEKIAISGLNAVTNVENLQFHKNTQKKARSDAQIKSEQQAAQLLTENSAKVSGFRKIHPKTTSNLNDNEILVLGDMINDLNKNNEVKNTIPGEKNVTVVFKDGTSSKIPYERIRNKKEESGNKQPAHTYGITSEEAIDAGFGTSLTLEQAQSIIMSKKDIGGLVIE